MGEKGDEYLLQWDEHAKHVTKRFSGLFARQALVDTTLICDRQKLRVHKLILASCSLYFEEILQQDLGNEPVICLDLNFEILKALIEWMYCGETSISQHFLPALLEAAKNFKVKELARIVEKTLQVPGESSEQDISDDSLDEKLSSNGGDDSFSELKLTENTKILVSSPELESSIVTKHPGLINFEDFHDHYNRVNGFQTSPISEGKDEETEEQTDGDYDTVKINYDNFGEFANCEKWDDFDDNSKVGQCLKVYSPKKKFESNKSLIAQVENFLPGPSSTTPIDLSDESLREEKPITLQSSLNADSLDNVLSLDSEGVSVAMNGSSWSSEEDNERLPFTLVEDSNVDNQNCDTKSKRKCGKRKRNFENVSKWAPLRRSLRLNLQDCDANGDVDKQKLDENANRKKEILEYELGSAKIDENSNKKNGKKVNSDYVNSKKSKNKEQQNGKCKSKSKVSMEPHEVKKKFFMVTESIDRSLWGDMSDLLEHEEMEDDMKEYYEEKPNIPFAVGLLPLQAALERMQAMPEHQPRKTRSSVAPSKNQTFPMKKKERNEEASTSDANKIQEAEEKKVEAKDSPSSSSKRKVLPKENGRNV